MPERATTLAAAMSLERLYSRLRDLWRQQQRARHVGERTEEGDVQRARVVLEGFGDDQIGTGGAGGRGGVGERGGGAVGDADLAFEVHQAQEQHHFVVAVLEAGRRLGAAEMRRHDAVQLERRGQECVDDRELVVGLVLGIGIQDHAGALFGGHRWRLRWRGGVAPQSARRHEAFHGRARHPRW